MLQLFCYVFSFEMVYDNAKSPDDYFALSDKRLKAASIRMVRYEKISTLIYYIKSIPNINYWTTAENH